MKMRQTLALGALLAAGIGTAFGQSGGGGRGRGPQPPGLALSTPDFEDGGVVPNKYTQADPMPVSPKLEWKTCPREHRASCC